MASPPSSPEEATNLFSLPFKQALDHTSLRAKLTDCIVHVYGEPVQPYLADLHALDDLRGQCRTVAEVGPELVLRLQRYYAQLTQVSRRFPADVCGKPGLSWRDGFPEVADRPVAAPGLSYDRAATLFNLAAVYSALALREDRLTVTGLKRACHYYQQAAGVLDHLQSRVVSEWTSGADPTEAVDFQPGVLTVLRLTMLAQAQECFWQKAVSDRLKDSLVAKLARETAALYTHARDALHASAVRSHFPAAWEVQLTVKAAHFEGVTQYRAACDCMAANRFGEEISRLRWALARAQRAATIALPVPPADPALAQLSRVRAEHRTIAHTLADLASLQRVLASNLQRAEKDNDVIYLDLVPPFDQLSVIPAASMVKPLPPAEVTDPYTHLGARSPLGLPLLAGLLPFAVHQAVSVYYDRKQQLVNERIVEPLDVLAAQYQSTLDSLRIPETLECLTPREAIPPSIQGAVRTVQSQGGCGAVEQLYQRAGHLGGECESLLSSIAKMVHDNPPPAPSVPGQFLSAADTSPHVQWRSNLDEYQRSLAEAKRNHLVTEKRLASWVPFFRVLGGAQSQIIAALPSLQGLQLSEEEHQLLHRLAQARNEADQMAKQWRSIVDEARVACSQDDIGHAASENGHQFEEIFTEQLTRYDPYVKRIEQARAEFTAIMETLASLGRAVSDVKHRHPASAARDKACANLKTAGQKYQELIDSGRYSIQFYETLTRNAEQLRDQVRDGLVAGGGQRVRWV
ncbi:pH-response regulator protein palA/rim20 [Tieghemiomyces parasiticus]|uniref:PH-response regulator protein palA/rim20 n=1 Tax=Tieghemiomyces parasiticus TaxID=78921 RepID=A0A9W8DWQ7_9FUNG|nr:pH-response regulator protein palA/rim20 [Tieghemiomyces parasiticus]